MNTLLRYSIFVWLSLCAIAVWIGVAIVGFIFAFTQYNYIYDLTPFIGGTLAFCTMKCATHVLLKSNPATYIKEKLVWFYGKTKI